MSQGNPAKRFGLGFLKRALFLMVFFALLVWFVKWEDVIRAISRVGWQPLALCVGIEWFCFAIDSWRLRVLSFYKYSFRGILRSRLVSLIVGTLLPGFAASELIRILLIDRERPGNKLYVALILLANRLYGVLSLASLLIVSIALDSALFDRIFGAQKYLILAGCVLVSFTPIFFRANIIRRFMVTSIRKFSAKPRRILAKVFLAIRQCSSNWQFITGLGIAIIVNMLTVTEFYVLGREVGVDLNISAWCLFVPLLSVAIFLPIGVGAVGTQDVTMIALAGFFDKPIEPFLAISVLMHVIRYVSFLPGLLYLEDLLDLVQKAKQWFKRN